MKKVDDRVMILIILASMAIVLSVFYFSKPPAIITNYPSRGTDIIAFGDSLVEGVGSSSGKDFVSILSQKIGQPIINLGHSGDTSADGLARIDDLDEYSPKVVILLLGGNDYLQRVPVLETRDNLADIIKNIHARGAVVLLLGIRGGIIVDPFNSEFTNLRDTYHTAFVPDVLDGIFNHAQYMSDAVHPNDAGYSIIAERVYPVLSSVIK